jgi:hypothetical protein
MTIRHHREHLLDRAAMVAVRLMLGSAKGSVSGPSARNAFNDLMAKVPPAAGVTYHQETIGTVSGRWCRPEEPLAGAGDSISPRRRIRRRQRRGLPAFCGTRCRARASRRLRPGLSAGTRVSVPVRRRGRAGKLCGPVSPRFYQHRARGRLCGRRHCVDPPVIRCTSSTHKLRPDPEGRRGDLRLDGPCAHRHEHDYPRGRRSTINPIFSRSARKSLPWRPRQPRP